MIYSLDTPTLPCYKGIVKHKNARKGMFVKKRKKTKDTCENKKRVAAYITSDMFLWLEDKADDLQSTPSGFLRLMIHNAMCEEQNNK